MSAGRPATRYLAGDARDVRPHLFGPALALGGGGASVGEDAALQWALDSVRGCRAPCPVRLDIVVLRTGGADSYHAPLSSLDGVDSVETVVVESRRDADGDDVVDTVRRAEMVFLPGGDPCRYVRLLGGTRAAAAVDAAYARGGAVAGTSAGLIAAGGLAQDACAGRIDSGPALEDPYDARMTLSPGPFRLGAAIGLFADPHFVTRDRMGRALALLARRVVAGATLPAMALAVDEDAWVVVDDRSQAAVMGAGRAYVLAASRAPEVCRPGEPLTYSGVDVWRMAPGRSYDLARPPAEGSYTVSVREGRLVGDPY